MVFGNKKSEIDEIRETIYELRESLDNLSKSIIKKSDNNVVERLTDQIETLQETFTMFHSHTKSKHDEQIAQLEEKIEEIKRDHSIDVEDVMLLQRNVDDKFKQIDRNHKHVEENVISRDEFNRLKNRMERVIGSEVVGERLDKLHSIFETEDLVDLSWKSKIINLLRGGLAPMAEEDLISANMIPKSKYPSFLKLLEELGVVETKNITSYYLLPEFEWIFNYTNDITLLRDRLTAMNRKSREYHEFVGENLNLVDDNLSVIDEYVSVNDIMIDFLCENEQGKQTGLCVVYPSAKSTTKWLAADYKSKKTDKDPELLLISPDFPDMVKATLEQDGIKFRILKY